MALVHLCFLFKVTLMKGHGILNTPVDYMHHFTLIHDEILLVSIGSRGSINLPRRHSSSFSKAAADCDKWSGKTTDALPGLLRVDHVSHLRNDFIK